MKIKGDKNNMRCFASIFGTKHRSAKHLKVKQKRCETSWIHLSHKELQKSRDINYNFIHGWVLIFCKALFAN